MWEQNFLCCSCTQSPITSTVSTALLERYALLQKKMGDKWGRCQGPWKVRPYQYQHDLWNLNVNIKLEIKSCDKPEHDLFYYFTVVWSINQHCMVMTPDSNTVLYLVWVSKNRTEQTTKIVHFVLLFFPTLAGWTMIFRKEQKSRVFFQRTSPSGFLSVSVLFLLLLLLLLFLTSMTVSLFQQWCTTLEMHTIANVQQSVDSYSLSCTV